jgi:hypothetical protein
MALYGGQVQAINMTPDTSQSVAAARELAMTGAQGIAGMVGQVGDYFKQQGEKKKLIKQSDVQIDAALKLFPDLAPALQGYRDQLKDENLPLDDRMAIAGSISNIIELGVGEMRNARSALLEQQKFGLEQAYKGAQLGLKERQVAATEFGAQQGARPKLEGKKRVVNIDGQEAEVDIDEDQYGNKYVPGTGERILDLEKYVTGEEGALGGLPTPTSQVMPSDGSFKFSYDTRDKLPASSPTNRQISLDFNAAPSKNAKGIEIIIPNNATEEERQIAQEYVAKTQQYFAERGVNVPARGVRTAKENGRGTPNRFHTEPFFVGDAASRAVMEKDPDGYAQVLASTLGRIPGAMFIPPHKSNDPGAADGKFNERDFAKGSIIPALERLSQQRSVQVNPAGIDNALSMGGDMTQQAMGTPEQQAVIARMIEEGQGMAMAQNMPQGATPTEASQINQQAGPRKIVRGVLVKGPSQKETKIITGDAAKSLNLPAGGTYKATYEDGRMLDVETVKAAPTISEELALEKREEEKLAQQQAAEAVADKSTRMVGLMTELKTHPGFENLFGATAWPTWIKGSPGADAAALYKQIESLGFMEAIKDMKGMGALSNAEGEKASAAFVGLTPDMSEYAAKKKIDEVIGYIKKGQQRIQSGNLIETKENKSPSIGGANSYFNQFKQPPAR